MNKDRMDLTKRIFCHPEKEKDKKKEPNHEVIVDVKAGSFGSFRLYMSDANHTKENDYFFFSDRHCLEEMVNGMNDFLKILDSEIKD